MYATNNLVGARSVVKFNDPDPAHQSITESANLFLKNFPSRTHLLYREKIFAGMSQKSISNQRTLASRSTTFLIRSASQNLSVFLSLVTRKPSSGRDNGSGLRGPASAKII
jgi:hypothetical protein